MGKLLDNAIEYAIKAHAGQSRKAQGAPYILHPMEAAVIAGGLTGDEEVLAAAVLHDVVEDTEATLTQIEKTFGSRVAFLVASETEDKRRGTPPEESWKVRKEESVAALRKTTDEGVKIVWLADKLSNIRSIRAGVKEEGPSFFEHFNQKDPKMHEWYYREILDALSSLSGSAAYEEFGRLIDEVFGAE